MRTDITHVKDALSRPSQMFETASDADLVAAFIAATAGMAQEAASALATGITQDDVSRWRGNKWKRLTEPKRRALIAFLESGVGKGDGRSGYNEAREEEELARVGGIPDPLLRIMERESIAAVIRAQGMRDACRAARLEAEKALDRREVWGRGYKTTPMAKQPRPGEADETKDVI